MNFNKKTIDDLNVTNKKVLLRCDFNVPLDGDIITDENRLVGALPTIKYLIKHNAKIILCSHLGKPKGQPKKELSLEPIAKRLSQLLNVEVKFADDDNVVGENAKRLVAEMKPSDIVLLQNTRYRVEEEKNIDKFSKELASLADIYVDDAFGTSHRAHCSTAGVTKFIDECACGYLIQKELKFLGEAIDKPERPFVAILGGAKVSDKIKVINNLLDKVDILIIGGGMAFTFLKAQGYSIGNSLLEEDKMSYALEMVKKAEENNVKLLLPVDFVMAREFSKDAEPIVTENRNISEGYMGLDVGPKTRLLFSEQLKEAKTVIWNGPLGVFEFEKFAEGTKDMAKTLSKINGTTIIGGGDSAAAVNILGFANKMTHISTGGGASLEFLEGSVLPGIDVLDEK